MDATLDANIDPALAYADSGNDETHAAPSGGSAVEGSRPLTRSQTGHAPRRRLREEETPEPRKPPPRKRAKTQKGGSDTRGSQADDAEPAAGPSTSTQSTNAESPPQKHTSGSHTTVAFLNSPGTQIQDYAALLGPRARATLPIPVPNLTKKSRGRRVPIKPTEPTESPDSSSSDSRGYICKVDGCGKAFHRGEHLKRHIRSIHTHEKPFQCSYPTCTKTFNRHDNLLQHLKVHKDMPEQPQSNTRDRTNSYSHLPQPNDDAIASPTTPAAPYNKSATAQPLLRVPAYDPGPQQPAHASFFGYAHPQRGSFTQAYGQFAAYVPAGYQPAPVGYATQTGYVAQAGYPSQLGYATYAPTGATELPIATNMAISSLRTEIPQSPHEGPGAGVAQESPVVETARPASIPHTEGSGEEGVDNAPLGDNTAAQEGVDPKETIDATHDQGEIDLDPEAFAHIAHALFGEHERGGFGEHERGGQPEQDGGVDDDAGDLNSNALRDLFDQLGKMHPEPVAQK
ncbi:hypothetical protein GGG16DRAFT_124335 [Schizophyllum commune]